MKSNLLSLCRLSEDKSEDKENVICPRRPRNLLEALFQAGLRKPSNEVAEEVKKLTPQQQVDYVMEALPALSDRTNLSAANVVAPISALLRRKLPFTSDQILRMVQLGGDPSYYFPFPSVLRLAESVPMTPELAEALRRMRGARVLVTGQMSGHTAIQARIDELLNPKDAGAPFAPAGAWSRQIAAEVTPAWRSVLEAGREISGREPTRKWREAAAARVAAIGRERFRETSMKWLELGPSPGEANQPTTVQESDYQRGLLWSLIEISDAETTAAIARFAEQCLRKIPAVGPVSQRAGNACVGVLAAMSGPEAVAQLARLALRIKYQTAQRLVQEALEEAAKRQGLSREELEEITVPTFGLDGSGSREERCGEHVLVLTARGDVTCRGAGRREPERHAGSGKARFHSGIKRAEAGSQRDCSAATGASRAPGALAAYRTSHSYRNMAHGISRSSADWRHGAAPDLAILQWHDRHLA